MHSATRTSAFSLGGAAENSELLLDVGSAVPDNGALAPVHIDGHRQTAGGFTEDPVSSGAKPASISRETVDFPRVPFT